MRRTFSYCAAEKYLASRLALILAWPLRSFRRRAELPPPSGHRWEAAAARRVDGVQVFNGPPKLRISVLVDLSDS